MNSQLKEIYKFEKSILKLINQKGLDSINYAEQLDKFKVLDNISEEQVFQLALRADLPKQYYSENQFGYFNVTLINNDFFNLQIYIMNDIHTEVHNHAFEGAFKLLTGETIHKNFEWKQKEKVANAVYSGELKEINSRKFSPGDMSSIALSTVHQILRLADINITLILIDKKSTPESAMNGYFLPPSLYIENFDLTDDFKRKIFCLSILKEKNPTSFQEELKLFINQRHPLELFSLATRLNSYSLELDYKDDIRKIIIESALNELKSRDLYHYIEGYFKYIKSQEKKVSFLKG